MSTEKHHSTGVVSELHPQDIEYQAAHWLAVLDGDDPSAEQIAAFQRWKTADQAHRQAFEELLALWGHANLLTRLEPPARQRLLGGETAGAASASSRAQSLWPQWPGMAALSLLVVLTLVAVQPWQGSEQRYQTAVGEQQHLTLADNSRVILNTDSRLRVDYQSGRRVITLDRGEAHFDVAHDPQRPFEVYAGKGRVQALGTAFTVRLAHQRDDVAVYVTEGVVEVYSQSAPAAAMPEPAAPSEPATASAEPGDPAAIIVAEADASNITRIKVPAGLRAAYGSQDQHITVAPAADLATALSWRQGKLVFNGEPLATVIAEFSRYTPIKIIVPSEAMRAMKVGGIFKIGDTAAMFDALQNSFGIQARYVSEGIVYLEYIE